MFERYLSVAVLAFRKSPIVALANVTVLALRLTAFVATYAATDFWNNSERKRVAASGSALKKACAICCRTASKDVSCAKNGL